MDNIFPEDKDCPVCPKKINYSRESFNSDLSRYISVVKEKDRTDESEYKRRLEICAFCKYQSNGLCTQCGCFTEIRCVLKTAKCAAPKALW